MKVLCLQPSGTRVGSFTFQFGVLGRSFGGAARGFVTCRSGIHLNSQAGMALTLLPPRLMCVSLF